MKKQKYIGDFFKILSILLLSLLFISGCVQNSTSPPTLPKESVSQSSIRPLASSSESPQDSVNLTDNNQPLRITIHSAFKTMKIHNSVPYSGNIFVIINMTIENRAHNVTYWFNQDSVQVNGIGPITQKLYTQLTNPLYFGSITPNDNRSGEVVFGVNKSIQLFTFKFLDNSGKIILTEEIGNIVVKNYSPKFNYSSWLSDLLDSKNFSYVIENLDTPAKAAQYIEAKYTYEVHFTNCTSYSPEEFFQIMIGDCKDVATFFSYILAHHGHDAKMISFKFYKDGERIGHVVTLFTDTDGKLKYATTPDVRIFRDVNSVDDLLMKECSRLDVSTIANYRVLPAGSLKTCVE